MMSTLVSATLSTTTHRKNKLVNKSNANDDKGPCHFFCYFEASVIVYEEKTIEKRIAFFQFPLAVSFPIRNPHASIRAFNWNACMF